MIQSVVRLGWLVELGFNVTLSHIMAVGDTNVFPGFLTPALTQHSFQSHQLPFFTCFGGERQKYAKKKVCLNWV